MSSVTIDLMGGRRSARHAHERYNRLEQMLRDIISLFRHDLLFEYAQVLVSYRKTSRWRIREQSHWVLELDEDEWRALSRGLRGLATPAATSMYQWLNLHKVLEDG